MIEIIQIREVYAREAIRHYVIVFKDNGITDKADVYLEDFEPWRCYRITLSPLYYPEKNHAVIVLRSELIKALRNYLITIRKLGMES